MAKIRRIRQWVVDAYTRLDDTAYDIVFPRRSIKVIPGKDFVVACDDKRTSKLGDDCIFITSKFAKTIIDLDKNKYWVLARYDDRFGAKYNSPQLAKRMLASGDWWPLDDWKKAHPNHKIIKFSAHHYGNAGSRSDYDDYDFE